MEFHQRTNDMRSVWPREEFRKRLAPSSLFKRVITSSKLSCAQSCGYYFCLYRAHKSLKLIISPLQFYPTCREKKKSFVPQRHNSSLSTKKTHYQLLNFMFQLTFEAVENHVCGLKFTCRCRSRRASPPPQPRVCSRRIFRPRGTPRTGR